MASTAVSVIRPSSPPRTGAVMKMLSRTDEWPYKVGEWLSIRRERIFTLMWVSAPVAFVVPLVIIDHFETALLVGFVAHMVVIACCYAALNVVHRHRYGVWIWPW